ncbi:MAG: HD domain-containing protein [Solirubrobacterales bacterium]
MPATPRIEAAAERSQLVRDALQMAHQAHAGQIRNGSGGMAYVDHPRAVAELLAAEGYPDEVLAAALLHDVVEDSEMTVEVLRKVFGSEVAGIVAALSDDESIDPYRDRKDEHRERVQAAGGDALAIYGADKLNNLGNLHRAHAVDESAVEGEFNVPIDLKLDVWADDLAMLRDEAPELPFLDALEAELNALRAERGARSPQPGA